MSRYNAVDIKQPYKREIVLDTSVCPCVRASPDVLAPIMCIDGCDYFSNNR